MSGQGDARLQAALLERLARGPADALDLLAAARAALGPTLAQHEGALHALLQRLVRAEIVRVGPPSPRGLAGYLGPRAAADDAPAWQPPPADRGPVADAWAVVAVSALRDPVARARVQADLEAHRAALRAQGDLGALGSARALRALLKRADRPRQPAVFLPQGVGGALLRFVLHEGPWILAAAALYLVLNTFFVKVFVIPSPSMLPTLQLDDRVLVRKAGAGWSPERWRIVTYVRPGPDGPRTTYVKRVAGLGGERIALWRGDLYVGGHLIAKPEELNAVVRARVRAWAFDDTAERAGWQVLNREAGVDVWVPPGERLWAGPYDDERRFELQDIYLELDLDLGVGGGAELHLTRGREGTERTGFVLAVHPRAGVALQRQDPGERVSLATAPSRLTGRVTLRLALVDGVLRAQVGDFVWRGPVQVPAEAAGFSFVVQEGARPLALRLDKDLHYGVHGALAVPKDGRAQRPEDVEHEVRQDAVFCLGDNTDDSRDSRYQDVGDIPHAQLVGPVIWRLWPPSRFGRVR